MRADGFAAVESQIRRDQSGSNRLQARFGRSRAWLLTPILHWKRLGRTLDHPRTCKTRGDSGTLTVDRAPWDQRVATRVDEARSSSHIPTKWRLCRNLAMISANPVEAFIFSLVKINWPRALWPGRLDATKPMKRKSAAFGASHCTGNGREGAQNNGLVNSGTRHRATS